ncbi:MAG TPA: c-type cytochrome [Candidatus Krumholzibacteria bacterium]|nr:c-type cytochrome [Candidatus Krumholzibacteria bacterium]
MTTRFLSAAAITLLLLATCLPALAADEAAPTPLSEMSGKDLYKNVCKQCHGADAKAGEYTPITLIQEQWEEFFDGILVETHKDLTCPKDESRKLLEVLDKDMIQKIREFCVDHAADSEQPMTCG